METPTATGVAQPKAPGAPARPPRPPRPFPITIVPTNLFGTHSAFGMHNPHKDLDTLMDMIKGGTLFMNSDILNNLCDDMRLAFYKYKAQQAERDFVICQKNLNQKRKRTDGI